MKLGYLGTCVDPQFGVEVGERLVEKEHTRLADDRAGDRDALALPAGQLPGLAIEERLDTQYVGSLVHAALDLVFGQLAELEPESDVVADRHVRIERVRLEHHGDVAILGRHVVDLLVADIDRAFGDRLEPCEHPQGGGLSAPGGSHEYEELLVFDLEVEVLESDDIAEPLPYMVVENARHGLYPFTAPARMPSTKYFCSAKNTMSGNTIERNAAAVSRCHSLPNELTSELIATVIGATSRNPPR